MSEFTTTPIPESVWDRATVLEVEKNRNETRIYIAVIIAVAIVILSIIAALFIDEVIDHKAEQACVENTETKTDDYNDCDL